MRRPSPPPPWTRGRASRLRRLLGAVRRDPGLLVSQWRHCPLCGWFGPLLPFEGRPFAICPRCDALERHRLQRLVLDAIRPAAEGDLVVHAAPEPSLAWELARRARHYLSLDLHRRGVAVNADLRRLPFAEGCVDLLFASHVLEHVAEDRAAIAEIFRVLRRGGTAILPVPIVADRTVEYPAPRADEHGHVRAPGLDYFDRYREAGFEVRPFTSLELDFERHQLLVFPAAGGAPVADHVPVCRKP